MKTFLFWNLNKKPLIDNIVSLTQLYDIDVLMFCEWNIAIVDLLNALNADGKGSYYYIPGNCEKIKIFTKFPNEFIKPVYESDRLTIRHITLPGSDSILLAVIHFVDKYNWDDDSQNLECCALAETINKTELRLGHSRTILVGDLNMNPFQAGVIMAKGLHAVMTKKIALSISRKVQQKEYKFFYNPMWNLLGDHSPGVPGTYYLRQSVHKVYFWNMLDQVLIRPELLDNFRVEDLEIVEFDGNISLLNSKGYPNKRKYSDHLPIKFTLAI